MPRYYFHAHGLNRNIPDYAGYELDDLSAARELAFETIRDIASDSFEREDYRHWIMHISDEEGQTFVTIQYREFGVRLNFTPEILGDSLVKLRVRPEVSSLDYGNALLLAGFRIPALRTRRIESTVDVRRSHEERGA